MENGILKTQEEPLDNDLNLSQKLKNDNFFNNIKLSKTQIIDNIQSSQNIENNEAIFDTNPTIMSINQFTKTQNIIPEELTETQIISSSMQPKTNNLINSSEYITNNQTQLGANFSLGIKELNKTTLNYVDNNSNKYNHQNSIETPQFAESNQLISGVQIPLQNQSVLTLKKIQSNDLNPNNQGGNYLDDQNMGDNIPQLTYYQSQPGIVLSQHSPFIESQSIYEKKNTQQSEFVESHHIYDDNPEQIIKYKISKHEDNNFNEKPELISHPQSQNNNSNEKKNDNLITDEETKNVENQFKSLKISKTKYLSEEELANLMNNNDNPEDNINKNKEEKNEFVYISNPIKTNIETEIVSGEEKNTNSNILGNDEIIKTSKTDYVKDDFNNYNTVGDTQEPLQEKKINNSKVLKIEDEENIHFCPDFITKFFKKLFG